MALGQLEQARQRSQQAASVSSSTPSSEISNTQSLEAVHAELGQYFDAGNLDQFKSTVSTYNGRKALYDELNKNNFDAGTFEEFTKSLGVSPKVELGEQILRSVQIPRTQTALEENIATGQYGADYATKQLVNGIMSGNAPIAQDVKRIGQTAVESYRAFKRGDLVLGTLKGMNALVSGAITGLALPLIATTELSGRIARDVTTVVATLAGEDSKTVEEVAAAAERGGSLEPIFALPGNAALYTERFIRKLMPDISDEEIAKIAKLPRGGAGLAVLLKKYTPEQQAAADEAVSSFATLSVLPKAFEAARGKPLEGAQKVSIGEKLLGLEPEPSAVQRMREQVLSGMNYKTSPEDRTSFSDEVAQEIRPLQLNPPARFQQDVQGKAVFKTSELSEEQKNVLSKLNIQLPDLKAERQNLQDQLDLAKIAKDKKKAKELKTQIKDVDDQIEGAESQLKQYGYGEQEAPKPTAKIPEKTTTVPPVGEGENIPSNINFTPATEPGAKTVTEIPVERLQPVKRGAEGQPIETPERGVVPYEPPPVVPERPKPAELPESMAAKAAKAEEAQFEVMPTEEQVNQKLENQALQPQYKYIATKSGYDQYRINRPNHPADQAEFYVKEGERPGPTAASKMSEFEEAAKIPSDIRRASFNNSVPYIIDETGKYWFGKSSHGQIVPEEFQLKDTDTPEIKQQKMIGYNRWLDGLQESGWITDGVKRSSSELGYVAKGKDYRTKTGKETIQASLDALTERNKQQPTSEIVAMESVIGEIASDLNISSTEAANLLMDAGITNYNDFVREAPQLLKDAVIKRIPSTLASFRDQGLSMGIGLGSVIDQYVRAAQPLIQKIKSEFDDLLATGKIKADQNEAYFRKRFMQLSMSHPDFIGLPTKDKDQLFRAVMEGARGAGRAAKQEQEVTRQSIIDKGRADALQAQIESVKGLPDEVKANIVNSINSLAQGISSTKGVQGLRRTFSWQGDILARTYGPAGGELSQRGLAGITDYQKRMMTAQQYREAVRGAADEIESITDRQKVGQAVADALNMPEANAIEIFNKLPAYQDQAKIIYRTMRTYFDSKMSELKNKGIMTIDQGYFPHMIESVAGGVDYILKIDSRFLKPREDVMKDWSRDSFKVFDTYIRSVERALALKDMNDYYRERFDADKIGNFNNDLAKDYILSLTQGKPVDGMLRFPQWAKQRLLRSWLWNNAHFNAMNIMQKNLADVRVTQQAALLDRQLRWSRADVSGRLADAIEATSRETPSYAGKLSDEGLDIPSYKKLGHRVDDALRLVDLSRITEGGNWSASELKGILNRIVTDPRFAELETKHGKALGSNANLIKIADEILSDPKAFQEAINEGRTLAAETQVDPSVASRAKIFNEPVTRMFLTLMQYRFRDLQLATELFSKQHGADAIQTQIIMRKGLTDSAEPAVAIQEFSKFRKAAEQIYSDMKLQKIDVGFKSEHIKQVVDVARQLENGMKDAVKKANGTPNVAMQRVLWAKYRTQLFAAGAIVNLFNGFYNAAFSDSPKDDEDIVAKAILAAILDAAPGVGMYPTNPLLPKIESMGTKKGWAREMLRYGFGLSFPLFIADRVSGYSISNTIVNEMFK